MSLALYDVTGRVATITMNRPERLNTMTDEFLDALLEAVERAADDGGVDVVVLTGAGRAFCAGGDLSGGAGSGIGGTGGPTEAERNLRTYMRIAHLLHKMPKPTIAAVRGACAGAGLSLACAADLRYASRSAVFVTAFLNAGVSGDFGGTWTLSRIIGPAQARAAYLLSPRIDAEEAGRIGLITEVVDDDALEGRVAEIAAQLAAAPQTALRLMKANLNDALELPLSDLLDREAARHIICARTPDAAEASAAFIEKRTPVYAHQR
jgi:2-(1,2-epoxy-1,2-dihydrophenyl)acetyl-CoA isomerase